MPQAEDTHARVRADGQSKTDAGLLLGRSAPHNIDAEEALLACCVIDPAETLSLCHEKGVRPESFYRPAHQIIFR
jgi:replicative DNA helicase